MTEQEMKDFVTLPHIQRTAELMNDTIKKNAQAFLKFTCLNCQSRQTIEQANTIYTSGLCEECNHTSDFRNPAVNLGLLYMAGTPSGVIDAIFNQGS